MSDDERAVTGRRNWPRRSSAPELSDESWDVDEDTSPRDLLRREATEEDIELARMLGREASDPITVLDFAKFLRGERRRHKEHRSGNKQLEQQFIDLLNRPPNEITAELQRDVVQIRLSLRVAKGIAIAAISAAIAALGGWVDRLMSHDDQRIERIERSIEQHQNPRDERPRIEPPMRTP